MKKTEYNKYFKVVEKITSNSSEAQDLMHDVLLMLHDNQKYNNLSEKDRLFFFVRAIQNQYNSKSSYYTRTYKKYHFQELQDIFCTEDDIYVEKPSIDWIKETLEIELQNNPDFWYNKGIFELWIKHQGFIERVHKQTKIPRYSLKETISQMKDWINQKWKEYKDADNQVR